MRECTECGIEFDPNHPEKRRVGGKINECPQCADEKVVKYLGLQSADGKMAGVTILAFDNKKDREKYRRMWWNNSGMNRGKSCQLGGRLSPDPHVKFRKVHEAGLNMNHKGQK